MTLDIDALLSELTLEEKASLTSRARRSGTRRRSSGSASRRSWCRTARTGCAPSPGRATTSGWAAALPATCFPTASAIASAWNPELLRRIGEALAQEARACNLSVILGPGINMKRSPLCGRNFEYFSEDPYLAGELGVGIVDGIQSRGRRHLGQALRGQQPGDRPAAGGRAGRRAHPAGDLPAGVRADRHGVPAVDDHVLLQQGQRAVGVGEPVAAHDASCARSGASRGSSSPTGARSTTGSPRSLAGLDLEMPPALPRSPEQVVAAVAVRGGAERGPRRPGPHGARAGRQGHGRARAGRGVRRRTPTHHALAREAAAESVVLLKNDGACCRCPRRDRIAVIGEFARTPRFQGAGQLAGQPDPGRHAARRADRGRIGEVAVRRRLRHRRHRRRRRRCSPRPSRSPRRPRPWSC